MTCFGLFSKIKKKSGTSFSCKFSTWFSHKNVPYLILDQLTKFQYYSFSAFSRSQMNYVIKFSFRQLITPCTLRYIFDHPLKQWQTGRKWMGRRQKYKNLNVSRTMSFFGEIKTIFHNYLRTIIWWKSANAVRIALKYPFTCLDDLGGH